MRTLTLIVLPIVMAAGGENFPGERCYAILAGWGRKRKKLLAGNSGDRQSDRLNKNHDGATCSHYNDVPKSVCRGALRPSFVSLRRKMHVHNHRLDPESSMFSISLENAVEKRGASGFPMGQDSRIM